MKQPIAFGALVLAWMPIVSLQGQGSGALALREGDYIGAPMLAPDPDLKEMPSLKKCDPKRYAIGYISGSGVISYVISAEGKADTSSIKIIRQQGVSVKALSSIAHRVLAACDFRPAKTAAGKVPALVTQQLAFRSALDHPQAAPWKLPLPGDSALTSSNGKLGDRALSSEELANADEAPAPVTCPSPGIYGHGRARYAFVVEVDGKVDSSSMRLLSSTGDARLDEAARKSLQACIYAPGRVDGVPIRAFVIQGFVFR